MNPLENFGVDSSKSPEEETKTASAPISKINPAIIPAAFAAVIGAGEVQAEDIETIHGQDWLKGVEILRESVMSAESEVGATFVIGEDGTQYWYSSGRGEATSVKNSTDDLRQLLDQFSKESDEAVDRFCNAHTHPLVAMAEVDFISDEELAKFQALGYGPSAPPSLQDISPLNAAKTKNEVGDMPYFNTVFDPQGLWYSRAPIATDYELFPDYLAEVNQYSQIYETVFNGSLKHTLETISDSELRDLVERYGSEDDLKKINANKEMADGYASVEGDSDALAYSEMLYDTVRRVTETALLVVLKNNTNINHPLLDKFFKDEEDRSRYQTFVQINSERTDNNQFYLNTTKKWVEASKDGKIDESLLPQIYEAFIRNGALVRFVPYDQVPNEPPCAGPDYKPE